MSGTDSLTVADALAAALLEADVRVVTHVPGYGASATFEALRRRSGSDWPLSLHEEVAYGMAHGAAVRGGRAASLMKTHGLAKAANAVLASLSSGLTAGFVTLVFDDATGGHSDNVLDAAALLDGLGIPWERAKGPHASAALTESFRRSERLQLPVVLLLDADASGQPHPASPLAPALLPPPAYRRDVTRHIVCPLFAPYQHRVLQARRAGRTAEEVPRPTVPRLPEGLPPAWQPQARRYAPLFDALRTCPRSFTAGDTGLSSLFALPPYDAIDLVCYLGGSVPLAAGAALAGFTPAWAITGDFSFAAAGHLGLLEAAQRALPLKVVVVHNGRSEATGGQPLPAGALERALAPFTPRVRWLREVERSDAVAAALAALTAATELAILVVELP